MLTRIFRRGKKLLDIKTNTPQFAMYESNRIVQLSVYIALILILTQTVHCLRLQGESDLEPDESYEYGPMWPWQPSVQFDRIDDDSRPFEMPERSRFERLHGKPSKRMENTFPPYRTGDEIRPYHKHDRRRFERPQGR
ncbi:hypothetical protein P879_03093 [Paragonimus westermani]|uniref:Uncharacterized protein n=1 Tax=Paragonimus westermani TaxID=34504 RepID=A0A8T0DN01_9TREM|nr:hypothetical protein P879_03093 [Paragonimus westermani]